MQVIGNRYEIQRELGMGGMGVVFLGLDRQTKALVAIKQLKKELSKPEMIERFKREGQALRELNHPNIVKLLDALEHEGQQYLVMEHISGGDLRQLLQGGGLPWQRCLNIAIDLADALTRAHRLNIVHRDLKPANVLIADDDTIRLSDFGLAHVVDKERVTKAKGIIGTLEYLAPELFDGQAIEPRSDIWSFGVMLFELLAGQRPFDGNSLQLIHAILNAPIPDLEALAPDVPTAFVDLVYRMLCRDPQARIISVRYVGAALEDILQGREFSSRFETPVVPLRQRPKHNLPAQTTAFVGRESELSEVSRLIENPNNRLISIVAQGGMGKSRLSLEIAERQLAHFEDGVYFVELAPLGDSASIVPAIASALGYPLQNNGREFIEQLSVFLQDREVLLVLDNFEHLLDGAGIVSRLLSAAPKLKILVTSRQRLELQGESLFHLSGMDFPNWESPDDALDYAAVKLFMNSALRVRPNFELTREHLKDIASICRFVQGMPLGIVLAASWLGMLSPAEVSEELQKSLDILESESKDIPERQRSIRSVMEYSWKQMNAAEQEVFAKLAVFRGGFSREAAEAVAGANLRILMSLVSKSLLRRDNRSGRYEIHELLRQYAEEQARLQESRDAHGKYFARWLKERESDLAGNRDIAALKEIQLEFENIKAAWYWNFEAKAFEALEQMLDAFSYFIIYTGYPKDKLELFKLEFNLAENPRVYAKLQFTRAGQLPFGVDKLPALEEDLRLARQYLDKRWQGEICGQIGVCLAYGQNFSEALAFADEAIALLAEADAKWLYAMNFHQKAYILFQEGKSENVSVAYALMEKSYELFTVLGNVYGKSVCLYNMGVAQMLVFAEYELALKAMQDKLLIAEEQGNISEISHTMFNTAALYIVLGDFVNAEKYGRESYALAAEYAELEFLSSIGALMVDVFALMGKYEEAKAQIANLYQALKRYENFTTARKKLIQASFSGEVTLAFCQNDMVRVVEFGTKYLAQEYKTTAFMTTILIYLGCAEIVTGDWQNAEMHLRQALPRFVEPRSSLHALYGLAVLAHARGQNSLATEYAALVFEHRATYYEFLQYTKTLLKSLESAMPAVDYQAAYERGKALDLDTVVEQILEESSEKPQ